MRLGDAVYPVLAQDALSSPSLALIVFDIAQQQEENMRRLYVAGCFVAQVLMSGCASNPIWSHPDVTGDGGDMATLAFAECQAYASGTAYAPVRSSRMDVPQPTSYTATGTVQRIGQVGYINGTATANSTFGSKFASGFNSAAGMADAIEVGRYRRQVEEVANACMRTKGWIDTSTPEGQSKLKGLANK